MSEPRAAITLEPLETGASAELGQFLGWVDLTVSGLESPTVRLWVERNSTGAICGSAGFELSADGRHALIRSVAVLPSLRGQGCGLIYARFALEQAAAIGVRQAWLFSRRSGPFWQRLGFEPADRAQLATVLADTHQVRLFRQTGQLDREVAWTRPLSGNGRATSGNAGAACSEPGPE